MACFIRACILTFADPSGLPSFDYSDDDDTHEFSKGLAQQYVEQAESTFDEMDEALYVTLISKRHKTARAGVRTNLQLRLPYLGRVHL